MATAQQLAEFREATQSLTLLAQRDLEDFLRALNLAGNPVAVRDALLEFFPELVAAYGDAAALLGADFYDSLRNAPPSAASFTAALAAPPVTAQLEATTRWAVGPLFAAEPDAGAVLSLLAGATQRHVMQSARDTVFNAAARDPIRTGFARVPRGAVTCRWCTMIASRGPVYATAAKAGESNRWHDACDCAIVPMRGADDYPEGYDPERYMQAYSEGVGVGRPN